MRKLSLILIGVLIIPGVAAAQTEDVGELKEKFRKGTVLLKKIESSLENQEKNLSGIQTHIQSAKVKLKETHAHIETLKDQLTNLQNLQKTSARKIVALRRHIAERENEITIIRETITRKRVEKNELFRKMQTVNAQKGATSDEGLSSLSVLLAFANLGQGMQHDYFTDLVTEGTFDAFDKIDRLERELALTVGTLQSKTKTLNHLKTQADSEMKNLKMHHDAKKRLLALTKGKEEIYAQLVEESKEQQKEIEEVISNLKDNFDFVEEKLADIKDNEFLKDEVDLDDFESALGASLLNTDSPLHWPVNPALGITAYFHDGAYHKTMGIPHNAIDIPVIQGTKVHAAQTGVVHKVVNNDDAKYNYVILAHRDGFLTLYGHLSDIMVKEGDTVFVGQTIALSGGLPGTRGAGWLTTGAHLHLEVFKNWKHVDPLEYLPLEYLPIEFVPKDHLDRLTDSDDKPKVNRKEKVKRAETSELEDDEVVE